MILIVKNYEVDLEEEQFRSKYIRVDMQVGYEESVIGWGKEHWVPSEKSEFKWKKWLGSNEKTRMQNYIYSIILTVYKKHRKRLKTCIATC